MENLTNSIDNIKQMYGEIFTQAFQALVERIDEIKPSGISEDVLHTFPANSAGRAWQTKVLDMLTNDISKEILRKWQELLDFRQNFSCSGCATCCNLACSEFSYSQLQEKAKNGDKFAIQFTQLFVPYETRQAAARIYPEYVQSLEGKENVYFYHCPKLNECNRCTDYENRPAICRNFPDNPLDILPKSCGFYEWKKQVEPVALMLHAMVEIIEYYTHKIPTYKD